MLMRDGVKLSPAAKKHRGQRSPCNEVCDGKDTKVRGRITLVKQWHAKLLKQSLCKTNMRSARGTRVNFSEGCLRA